MQRVIGTDPCQAPSPAWSQPALSTITAAYNSGSACVQVSPITESRRKVSPAASITLGLSIMAWSGLMQSASGLPRIAGQRADGVSSALDVCPPTIVYTRFPEAPSELAGQVGAPFPPKWMLAASPRVDDENVQ